MSHRQTPSTSQTHAAGILPSASFFHPSRPSPPIPTLPPISPPKSPVSLPRLALHHLPEARTLERLHSPQQPSHSHSHTRSHSLSQSHLHFYSHSKSHLQSHLQSSSQEQGNDEDWDDLASIHTHGPASTTDDLRRQVSKRGLKHSREPLLPIGAGGSHSRDVSRGGSLRARTMSASVGAGQGQGPGQGQARGERGDIKRSASRRVRNSIEKVFGRVSSSNDGHRSPRTEDGHIYESSSPPHTQKNSHNHTHTLSAPISLPIPSPSPPSPLSPPLANSYLSPTSSHSNSTTPTTSLPHFTPTLPQHPLFSVRVTPPERNYQSHPSRNRFLFQGHLLTGGDSPWAFIFSLTAVFGFAGVWSGTTAVWWWRNLDAGGKAVVIIGGYMSLITIGCLFSTAFSDPGILPRNLDIDPPFSTPSDGGERIPLPRDLKVRNDVVRVKWCHTCKTYRPPRSSHCKMCDNCVEDCDHHCQWVNNCVGRRNYMAFFSFLICAILTLALLLTTSALHLYLLTRWDHLSFSRALQQGAGSAVVFAMAVVVVWPLLALIGYHSRLLFLNSTTIEQIRNQAHKSLLPAQPAPPNPFTYNTWYRNFAWRLCRPITLSWVDPPGWKEVDLREVVGS